MSFGEFTSQGIIDVFEVSECEKYIYLKIIDSNAFLQMVCKLELKTKYVSLGTNAIIIEELFSSALIIARKVVEKSGNYWVTDRQTNTMLRATQRNGYFYVDIFKMGYTENNFVPQFRKVSW